MNNTLLRSLGERQIRQVYLITYSQADERIVPDRLSFAEMVLESLSAFGHPVRPVCWCCCKERHMDGGFHYHMAIKFQIARRWLQMRNRLAEMHGIRVHFSSNHSNYFTAWQYVTKEDQLVIQSPGHPDFLDNAPPITGLASAARHNPGVPATEQTTEAEPSAKKKRRARLTAYEVSQIVVSKGLKSRLELLAFANRQKTLGKTDLAQFIINRGERVVNQVIKVTLL